MGELQAAGFRVEFQPLALGRQYFVDHATAEVGGTMVQARAFAETVRKIVRQRQHTFN